MERTEFEIRWVYIQKSFNIQLETEIIRRTSMCAIRFLVKLLVAVGALNWGLIGFFNYNLVASIFGGEFSGGTRTIYAIVGIAGVMFLWCWISKCCSSCNTCAGSKGSCGSCSCGKNSCGSCSCGKNKGDYCPCVKGSPSDCNCGPNCPRCSCGRKKYEQ
ncbi:MAG TPA: DUF378 domain-containing protein [Chlamydiales bacterium]|nr:DUF378 domain-containing protein [Chlamydiales bacterium]